MKRRAPSKKHYLISGLLLFFLGIIDMVSHDVKSYIFILSFFPLTYYFIYEDLKRDDERFKFIKNRGGFFTVIFSLGYLLVLYFLNYFGISFQTTDLIFLMFAGIVICFNATLIMLKNVK